MENKDPRILQSDWTTQNERALNIYIYIYIYIYRHHNSAVRLGTRWLVSAFSITLAAHACHRSITINVCIVFLSTLTDFYVSEQQ